jgi:flagellin-specific chaperone FliS
MPIPGIERYRHQQLESMTPEQLVLVAFQQAVRACRGRDRRRAQLAVRQLIEALDFEYEPAGQLLVLYEWVLRQIREAKFEEAGEILGQLCAAWEAGHVGNRSVPQGSGESKGETELPPDLAG